MGFSDRLSGGNKEKGRHKRHYKHPVLRRGLGIEMTYLTEQSVDLFKSMPMLLSSAEKELDQAEKYFDDGAFVPFWSSVETATKILAQFDELIGDLKKKVSCYTEAARLREDEDALDDMTNSYVGAVATGGSPDTKIDLFRITLLGKKGLKHDDSDIIPPLYPLAPQHIDKLADASKVTVKRLEILVQAGHRNYHFASIYEQRRTNQILIAGFANLGEALNRMTSKITASIDGLAFSIGVMSSTLNESLDAIHADLGGALEMLDNIQRGKRP